MPPKCSATIAELLSKQSGLTASDFAAAQETISHATQRIRIGSNSLIFQKLAEDGRHTLVIKVTQTDKGLFVTEFRRGLDAKTSAVDPFG